MNMHKIFAFSVGPIGAASLGLITLPIITWFFSPEDIGKLTMLQVTTSFTLLLFSLGLDQAYVREYHETKDKPGLLKAVFFPGFLILVIVLGTVVLSPWSASFLLFGEDSVFTTALLCCVILLTFASRFLSLILRMQERGLAFSMSQLLPKLLFLLIVLGYVWFGADAIFSNLIFANFLSVLTVFLIYFWNTRKDCLPALTSVIDRNKQLQMIRYAIPLIGSGVAFWGLTAMDRVFLRSLSTFEELGIYSISVSFAGAALVFQAIFSTVWAPVVYKWAAEGVDPSRIKKVIEFVVLFVVLIWSLAGVFSWLLLIVLPPNYERVQYVLLAAMAYPLLYTLSEATGVGIGIKRKTMFSLLATVSALLVNAIANWLLISSYGAAGAAIGSAIAFLVFFVIKTESSAILWVRFESKKMYSLIFLMIALSFIVNVFVLEKWLVIGLYLIMLFLGTFFYFEQVKGIFYFLKCRLISVKCS